MPRSLISDLHQSIRDFFLPFLFFAPFLRQGLFEPPCFCGVDAPTILSQWALLRLTRFAVRGIPSSTLSIITARSSSDCTADNLPFQSGFSRLSGFYCLSVELSLRTGLLDLCPVSGSFCDEQKIMSLLLSTSLFDVHDRQSLCSTNFCEGRAGAALSFERSF